MGSADRYADGEWNFFCDLCGKKEKSSRAMKTWDNHWVCAHHKEVRNPQDFVKGVKDNQTVPWARSEPTDVYVAATCDLWSSSALADFGTAGCSTVGNPATEGMLLGIFNATARAGVAIAGRSVSGVL
jgi:hypothetical protein